MTINRINVCEGKKRLVSFKSIRTDLNTVRELKTGDKPLTENKRENIQLALNKLAAEGKRDEIEQMLDVAGNLKYGIPANSGLSDEIDENFGEINKTEQSVWSEKLRETIALAISNQKNETVKAELDEKFKEVFSKKQPLTDTQKEILNLRENLLNQLNGTLNSADDETIEDLTTIKKLLDYFLISPDISEGQKKTCLEKMVYFMSEDFKINPQLKDKKVQALREMLNDMTIKTPEDEELLIKDVDQRESGICAAISVCRKMLAYEDKVRFMELVMNELDDSDYMEVYDITDLGSGKKVKADKADIDFDDALRRNYRILDASAHIWMQLAGTVGKGNLNAEHYVAFDKDNYEIFRDTIWYPELSEYSEQLRSILKYSIKTREFIKSAERMQEIRNKYCDSANFLIRTKSTQAGEFKDSLTSKLNSILENPQNTNQIVVKTLDFYRKKTDEGPMNFHDKMEEKAQEEKLLNFILSQIPKKSEKEVDGLKENIHDIKNLVAGYSECIDEIDSVKRANSPRSTYQYYKKLYLAAASHRLGIEEELKNPSYLAQYEQEYNLPPRQLQIKQDLSNALQKLPEEKEKDKVDMLMDINTVTTTIPNTMSEILSILTQKDTNQILIEYIDSMAKDIKEGNKEFSRSFAEQNNIKNSKDSIIKMLEGQRKQLQTNPSFELQENVLRMMGYTSSVHLAQNIFAAYINYISQNGITQEEIDRIEQELSLPFNDALNAMSEDIENASNTLKEIENYYNIPSREEKVLKKMEKDNLILSKRAIDKLETKFDSMFDEFVKIEQIKNPKERERAKNKVYLTFSEEDKETLSEIASRLKTIKRHTNKVYKELNEELKDELTEQYGHIGKLQGHFWLPEDGGSGLYSNQTLRLLEQMTGKPYYIETDALEAAKVIREGNGSGISSTSVDDTEYAMHAQYVQSITDEIIRNSETGESEKQPILWHDNTWGRSEKEHTWESDGRRYTDYGNGYGWKKGYILRNNMTTGTPLNELNRITGFSKKYQEKFPLFNDIIIPGESQELVSNVAEIFDNIFDILNISDEISDLERDIKKGKRVNIAAMKELDDTAYRQAEKLKTDMEKTIKSKADFDKLEENNPIKINLEKVALYHAIPSGVIKADLQSARTKEEFDEIKENVFEEQILNAASIFGKTQNSYGYFVLRCSERSKEIFDEVNSKLSTPITEKTLAEIFDKMLVITDKRLISSGTVDSLGEIAVKQSRKVILKEIKNREEAKEVSKIFEDFIKKVLDEDIKIKSLDNYFLHLIPCAKNTIKALDKHYNPKSDEELIKILQRLQNLTSEEYEKETRWLKAEDLITLRPPYEYLEQILAGHSDIEQDFDEMVIGSVITKGVKDDSADSSYRKLMVRLSDLDINRYIKRFQEQMFTKYKIRPAFPKLTIKSEEEIDKSAENFADQMCEYFQNISSYAELITIYNIYSKITECFENSPAFSKENLGKHSPSTIKLSNEERNNLTDLFKKLLAYAEQYQDMGDMKESCENILKILSSNSSNVKRINKEFEKIDEYFNKLNYGDLSIKTRLKDNQHNVLKEIQDYRNFYLETSILPKHRNEVNKQINKLILAYKKDSEKAIKDEKEKLQNIISKYYITREPVTLLNTYVKALEDPKTKPYVIDNLKMSLNRASEIAQLNKVEFKLVKNAQSGMATKTREILNSYITISKDEELKSTTGKDGLIYLSSILQNANTNNSTLNLFLTQTGLNEDCVVALIESYMPDKRLDVLDTYSQIICQKCDYIEELIKITNGFFENNKMKFSDYKTGKKQLVKYIEKQYKGKSPDRQELAKRYIETVNSSDVTEKNIPPHIINIFLESINEQFIKMYAKEIQSKFKELDNFKADCDTEIQLINSIDLNEDTDAGQKRKEFLEVTIPEFYKKANEKLAEMTNKLQTNSTLNISVVLKE